jgi:hypothetical protein
MALQEVSDSGGSGTILGLLGFRSATARGGFMLALQEVYENGQPRVAFTGEHPFTANDKRRRVPASTPPRRPNRGTKCPSLEADSHVAGHCPISQVVRPKQCRQSLHQSTGTQTKIGSYKSRLISGGFTICGLLLSETSWSATVKSTCE